MATWRNEGIQLLTLGSVRSDGTPDIADVLFQLQVPHESMTVRQAVIFDERRVPGRSGKVKQPVGYEDAEISVTLQLVDEEDANGSVVTSALEQYGALQQTFRDRSDPVGSTTARSVPTIYSISSRMTDACGITTVVFQDIDGRESPGSTDIEVTLTFKEFDPKTLIAERSGRKKTLTAQQEWDAYVSDSMELDYLDAMSAQDLATEQANDAHDEAVLEEQGRLSKAAQQGWNDKKAQASFGRTP